MPCLSGVFHWGLLAHVIFLRIFTVSHTVSSLTHLESTVVVRWERYSFGLKMVWTGFRFYSESDVAMKRILGGFLVNSHWIKVDSARILAIFFESGVESHFGWILVYCWIQAGFFRIHSGFMWIHSGFMWILWIAKNPSWMQPESAVESTWIHENLVFNLNPVQI
jgi:hypothetical protein